MLLQFGHWIMDMEITSIQTDSGMTGHILFIIILHNRSENVKAERGREGCKKDLLQRKFCSRPFCGHFPAICSRFRARLSLARASLMSRSLRGRCDASLSAGLCGLGTGNVDLIGIFERGGDETYLALLHAEKAAAAGCMPRLAVLRDDDAADVQRGDIVRVVGIDAHIAAGRADNDGIGLSVKEAAVRRDDLQMEARSFCMPPASPSPRPRRWCRQTGTRTRADRHACPR